MDGAIYADYPGNIQNPYTEVKALDLQNGHTLWSKQLSYSSVPALLFTMKGVVYANDKEGISALNGSNGQTLWQANIGDVVAIIAGS